MLAGAESGEGSLKILDHGSADESSRPDGRLKNGHQFRFEFAVWGNQIKKRYAIRNVHL
jgi:hypothetical protein